MANPKFIFLDGEILRWEEGKIHVASAAVKFGTAVFEGIRGYWNAEQEEMYLFRMEDHMRRLTYSQTFMRFDDVIDTKDVAEQTIKLLRANEFRETVHIMTTAYVSGTGGPSTSGPVGLAITASPRTDIPWVDRGCTAQVSSWQRVPDTAMPMRVKCNANYQNGRYAAIQAKADGYDTAILLNTRGKVSEGPGMCLFMIRDGKAVTPSVTNDILESITRETVLELFPKYCGVEVEERDIDRSELAAAEEAFFCGTAWEITPIIEIDRRPVGTGEVGPVVRGLQEVYFKIVSGEIPDHSEWRMPVYAALSEPTIL